MQPEVPFRNSARSCGVSNQILTEDNIAKLLLFTTTREEIAALPTVGVDLIRAEAADIWRLDPSGQAVLAEMSAVLGASSIKLGLDAVIAPTDTTTTRQVRLETLNLPASSCVQAPSGAVGWWPGNGNANDLVAGNNGTLVGDTSFAAARVGQGFKLDGSGDYVEIPDSAALKPARVSVETWVRFDSLETPIVSQFGSAGLQ